jgi:hypothetical protein
MSHSRRVALSLTLSAAALFPAAFFASACSSPPPAQSPEAAVTPEPAEAAPPSEPAASAAPEATPAEDEALVQTLFVREQPAACEAEGTRQCLMVRSSESEAWRLFYAPIEGFEYEPSYAYELRVAVSPTVNPPADAPALRYELVNVVSKTKVGM